jgi:hypothetical protein
MTRRCQGCGCAEGAVKRYRKARRKRDGPDYAEIIVRLQPFQLLDYGPPRLFCQICLPLARTTANKIIGDGRAVLP